MIDSIQVFHTLNFRRTVYSPVKFPGYVPIETVASSGVQAQDSSETPRGAQRSILRSV